MHSHFQVNGQKPVQWHTSRGSSGSACLLQIAVVASALADAAQLDVSGLESLVIVEFLQQAGVLETVTLQVCTTVVSTTKIVEAQETALKEGVF